MADADEGPIVSEPASALTEGDGPSPDEDVANQSNASALHHNIQSKGKNSYYYAHAPRDVEGVYTYKWDGQEAPKLLRKTVITDTSNRPALKAITKYSWADGEKKVTIYIPLEGTEALAEDQLELDWSPTSLSLKVHNYDSQTLLLSFKPHDEVEDVKLRRKADKVILSLTKKVAVSWYELKAKADS